MSKNIEEISFSLTKEYIELNKLLKYTGVVGSGAEAGVLITEGEVLVNGDVDTRKRKKLRSGDVVSVDNISIKVS